MKYRFYAHSLEGRPVKDWQPLEEHLSGVAENSSRFAAPFGGEAWAGIAGLWHDLGKYSDAFQKYLKTDSSPDPHVSERKAKIDHATAGAKHAVDKFKILGHLLANVIAGHHSGLLDAVSDTACLQKRLTKQTEPFHEVPDFVSDCSEPTPPSFLRNAFKTNERDAFTISFFVRMLFSCVVDADFLDTERFMNSQSASSRPQWPADILQKMIDCLCSYLNGLQPEDTFVNRQRDKIRKDCLVKANSSPGLFSLTVPTGGGKTFSSLAFALRHAIKHGLQRIVYVVPFTTIIEQNANVFRDVMKPLGEVGFPDPVLEHHSNLDIGKETTFSRLATENWDAPLVVTTSVQFYESLFANRTSRCRKLHNLASSVVILDEVQTLPVEYLHPCLRALQELATNYGASVLLCTATQPAIHFREDFNIGLKNVREIVHDPKRLYLHLKRVDVKNIGDQNDANLVERLRKEVQVLCVVNTRGHARNLFDALGVEEGNYHLSALMCPEHRSRVLKTISERLKRNETCRLVSTQLIEAGVDVDFPTVYRSLAGLDSIAQAAGRCNRNGRRAGMGKAFVFRSEHTRSEKYFAETTNCSNQTLDMHKDPLSLEAIEHYFKLYYWDQSSRWDAKKILDQFKLDHNTELPFLFGFCRAAKSFRLIDDTSKALIVPWGTKGKRLCEELRRPDALPDWRLLRELQRYSVQVPVRVWERALGHGSISLIHERFAVLESQEINYSEHYGLSLEDDCADLLNA